MASNTTVLKAFKNERNRRFAECDFIRLRWQDFRNRYEFGDISQALFDAAKTKYRQWLLYIQMLRDMPSQPDFDPETPNWPAKPE